MIPHQGYIVVGYRGTFAFGRDMSDVKFRKLTRILVHGKSVLCREVFKVGAYMLVTGVNLVIFRILLTRAEIRTEA